MMTLLFLPTNLQKKKPLKMNIFIFLLHFMTLALYYQKNEISKK
jgi:hypothetical protein